MRWSRSMGIVLLISLMWGRSVWADPIQLTFHEGSAAVGGIGAIRLEGPYTLNYSSSGGSIQFMGGELGYTSSDVSYPYPPPTYPIDSTFGFLIGVAAPGTSDPYTGPWLSVSGPVTGTITGPEGLPGRWGGDYSGTATSATVYDLTSQGLAQLPAPLLDILNHPDHLHLSVIVDGGNENILDTTLTFDPPSANEVPEPTALITFIAAMTGLAFRRRFGPARRERTGRDHLRADRRETAGR